jgi:hypothetical protein
MDVNYYLQREQIERIRADQAGPGAAGDAHRALADLYRQKIETYRSEGERPYQPRVQVG